MKLTETNLIHLIKDVHIGKEGIYYFFDSYIVSEINEGVVYGWEYAQTAIQAAITHYGKDNLHKISYISNRVNKYSVKPADWLKYFKSNLGMKSYAIVSYSEKGFINATIESFFLKIKNINRFRDLLSAINWVENSHDLNNDNFKVG